MGDLDWQSGEVNGIRKQAGLVGMGLFWNYDGSGKNCQIWVDEKSELWGYITREDNCGGIEKTGGINLLSLGKEQMSWSAQADFSCATVSEMTIEVLFEPMQTLPAWPSHVSQR